MKSRLKSVIIALSGRHLRKNMNLPTVKCEEFSISNEQRNKINKSNKYTTQLNKYTQIHIVQ